jgi:hypothetical protein
MKNYILIFRMDITTPGAQPSPEQMKEYMLQWTNWIGMIDAKGQLAEGGNHFSPVGRVLKPGGVITKKPYFAEDMTSVAGYILVNAKNLDEAVLLAEKCPVLEGENTSVEVRELGIPG